MQRSSNAVRTAVLVLLMALLGTVPGVAGAATRAGAAYFVDAVHGADGASGRSPGTAWRTLDRVNTTTFRPGDRILLRAGQSWHGQLWPKGSGHDGRPITIDRYGNGPKPAVHGHGAVSDTVRLFNQHDWEIRDLEVTNEAPPAGTPGANLTDLRGIHVGGDAGGVLRHFHIDSVDVHDVTGEVNWIGGDTANNAPGITFRTGWDRSKNTGGIVFRGTVADPANPGAPTVLSDVMVRNSTIKRTSFGGIIVKQHTGSSPGAVRTGWGERAGPDDETFTPHTDVVIRNNYITQDGTDYGCDGIYLTDVRGGLVERNVVHRTGTSGIAQRKAGGADSNGLDPDTGTTKITVQHNFVHHNGDGILLCQCGRNLGDTRIRYNVIAGNSRDQVYLISTRDNASLTTSPTVDYAANLYGGAVLPVPDSDTRPQVGDPLSRGGLTGPYGTERTGPQLGRALALRVAAGSPAIDNGLVIPDNGVVDYAGRPVDHGAPDIGAFEHRGP